MVKHAPPEDDVRLDGAGRFDGANSFLFDAGQFPDFAPEGDADLALKGKNKPPVARNDKNGKDVVIEAGRDEPGDARSIGDVLKNDHDPDHDHLTVKNHGKLHGEFGTLKLSAHGKWVYRLDNNDPDTDALGSGEHAFDKFKYTVTDGHGGKDTAVLKVKITGSDDAPLASINIDAVTADNTVNAAEESGKVDITGSVGGDVRDGDTVTLTVNGTDFTGKVASGHFSIAVDGAQLTGDADLKIEASVTTSDGKGHSTTAHAEKSYTVDTVPPAATITLDAVTADNVINIAEAGATTIAISGTVGGDVRDGDTVTLTVNGHTSTGAVSGGKFSIDVACLDLLADADKTIQASVTITDSAGNITTGSDTQAYSVDTTPPAASIALDAVTADDVINIAEGAAADVAITGTVGDDVKDGDTVILTVNGRAFTGIASGGTFSIDVAGSDLLADGDKKIDASVITADGAGNTTTATATRIYAVDTTAPTATIAVTAVATDNVINIAESASSAVAISGAVGDDVKDGDTVTLTVNGHTYSGSASGGTFSIDVAGADLLADSDGKIDASVTTADGAGNTTTATAAKAYTIDTTPPTASIAVTAVATDNVVNISESASSTVAIAGTVGDDAKNGDTVTLTVNGQTYTGTVSGGAFSINVTGADLLADSDKKIDASVTTADSAGNTATATAAKTFSVDTTAPTATIALNAVTADNVINSAEAAAVNVAITGTVGGDVKNGDTVTLTVNGHAYTGTVSGGAFSINVAGADLLADNDGTISASVKTADGAGNKTTATDTQAYTVDTAATATLAFNPVAGNDIVDRAEQAGTVAVAGTVTGEARDGDIVTLVINGHSYTGAVASGAFSIDVAGFDLLFDSDKTTDASIAITDAADNTAIVNASHAYAVDLNVDLTTLSATQGFVIQGDMTFDNAGRAVSSAGDINGDGFDDLIVGAPYGDDGGTDAGQAYVLFGTASGFGTADGSGRQVIDLATLTAAQGFIIQGDAAADRAGCSVSSAGDVNGDGFDDLIVGAKYGDDGGTNAGEAYIVFGTASSFGTADGTGRQVIDLATLTATQGFIIRGDTDYDQVGRSVSSAGDVNGDGFDDVIVGASRSDDGGTDAGKAYVVFGTASGFGTADGTGRQVIDLTTLTATQGFIIQGDTAYDQAGFSVSSAGDVNGDGFDDVIIGADLGDDGGNYAGEAYVVFGTTSGFGTPDGSSRQVIDLTTLTAAQGFIIQGDTDGDAAGYSVSSAGDVNGDGFDDLIVGAYNSDNGGNNAGEAYVVFGTASGFGATDGTGRQVIDLTNLSAREGFAIQGDTGDDYAGRSVHAAGDVNGDGFDDLIVGADGGDDGGTDAGEAYIIYGAATTGNDPLTQAGDPGAQTLIGGRGDDVLTGVGGADVIRSGAGNDLIAVTGVDFRKIDGGRGQDRLKIDGDGAALDLAAIGTTAIDSIEAIDLHGTGSQSLSLARHDLLHLSDSRTGGTTRLIVDGGAGDAVATTGAGWVDSGTTTIGSETYRIFDNGHAELLVDSDIGLGGQLVAAPSALTIDAVTIDNVVNAAEGGSTIAITGTVNDIFNNGGTVSIVVNGHTYSGSASGGSFSIDVAGTDLLADSDGEIDASWTLIDDFGDTRTATASHAYNIDTTPPVATIVLDSVTTDNIVSRAEGASTVTLTGTVTGEYKEGDLVILSVNDNVYVGQVTAGHFSIDVAGSDLLADRKVQTTLTTTDDAGNQATTGETHAYAVDLNLDLTTLSATQGFIIQGDVAYDYAGRSVACAGDVNGDGFADLIVGAPHRRFSGAFAGHAYVVFGSASGFGAADGTGRQVIDATTLTATQGFIIHGATTDDVAGYSVSSAGDVNGDGIDDLIVGAMKNGDGGYSAGSAYVVFGSTSGFGTTDGAGRQVIDLLSLSATQGFVIQGDTSGDEAGWSVSSAGDINGDGIDDLIVGAPTGDDGGDFAGEAYVVFGTAAGFGSPVGGRQVIDLTSLSAAQGFIIQGDAALDNAGYSVSSAGDVNGDGFDDLIVGAAHNSDGGTDAGAAYVVFGSASGFGNADGTLRQVLDLTSLTATEGFVIRGDTAEDYTGYSVSSAGDINGDGFDDIIVGAYKGDDGGDSAGEAYVVFGTSLGFGNAAGGRQVIDLTSLSATQGFIIQGEAAGDKAGFSVTSADDVNGDGFDDLIVGAALSDDGGLNAGKAYVLFGGAAGFGTADGTGRQVVDLTSLRTSQGFSIRGDSADDRAGCSVSSAGDVNGDGFADLMVGAKLGDDGGTDAGEAYIIYGAALSGHDSVVLTGSTAAETLIGGLGDDVLTGGGGADIIRSGAGSDTIGVTGTNFVKIDGGRGYDTLRMDGSSDVFDFAAIRNTAIDSIEAIDMSANGSQELDLARHDIFHLSDDSSGGITKLTVHGTFGDTVSTSDTGWTPNGTTTIGADTFRIFDNGHAQLLIDSDIFLSGGLI